MENDTRSEIVLKRIIELAGFSDQSSGISRMFGTPAFMEAAKTLQRWFNDAGLQTRIDNIGNVRGVLHGKDPKAKTLVIASHYDTVVNAGMFDGPLGIVVGLSLVEQLRSESHLLPFNIELVAFSDEEGVRFHTTFLGSKALSNDFSSHLFDKTDRDGISLSEAIKVIGGNPSQLINDVFLSDQLIGYFEIHIEQGPILYEEDLPVGLVTAIAGQKRAAMVMTGFSGHAGTVPMNMRKDALCCAAACILAIESYAQNNTAVLATVGKIDVLNQASNVIAGNVLCSLDVRSADEDELEKAWNEINMIVKEISLERNITIEINLVQETTPVKCDYTMNFLLQRAITAAGYPVKELVSGAGHDAVPMAAVTPVAMLFVKCFKGISHNPLEAVEIKDIAATLRIADQFLQNMSTYHNQQ